MDEYKLLQILEFSPSDHDYSCSRIIGAEDFAEICRSCLVRCEPNSIFKLTYNDSSFCNIFEICTSVQVVEGDGLPENICTTCSNQLLEFYELRQKCLESNSLLKEVLNGVKECSQQQDEDDVIENFSDGEHEIEEIVFKVEVDDHQIDTINEEVIDKVTLLPVQAELVKDEDVSEDYDSEQENKRTIKDELKKGSKRKIKIERDNDSRTSATCPTCSSQFENNNKLLQHCKDTGHGKPKKHICEICGKSFLYRNILQEHIRTHTKEKIYVCPVCGTRFNSKCNLNRHLKIHTGEKSYFCKVCGKGFIQKHSFLAHLRMHSGERPFICSYCGKGFTSTSNHRYHERKHEVKDIVCKMEQNEEPVENRTCKTCHKVLSSKGTLKQHMLIHDEKAFLCSECGKGFVTNGALQDHAKVHTDSKPFTCALCEKAFRHKGTWKSHILTHTGERPYVCKVCSKSFTQSSHIKLHMRTHSGEKPYSCSFCGKCFSAKSTLVGHIRIHTKKTPYVCDFCGKGFNHSTNMKKHRLLHLRDSSIEIREKILKTVQN